MNRVRHTVPYLFLFAALSRVRRSLHRTAMCGTLPLGIVGERESFAAFEGDIRIFFVFVGLSMICYIVLQKIIESGFR